MVSTIDERTLPAELRRLADALESAPPCLPLLSRRGEAFILAPPGGEMVALNFSVGLAYLAILLDRPGEPVSCTRLIEAVSGRDLTGTAGGTYEAATDKFSARQYRRALVALRAKQRAGDESKRTADQVAELERRLRDAGRKSAAGDGNRHAAQVRMALNRAMATIAEFAPHVDIDISIGTSCTAYAGGVRR